MLTRQLRRILSAHIPAAFQVDALALQGTIRSAHGIALQFMPCATPTSLQMFWERPVLTLCLTATPACQLCFASDCWVTWVTVDADT